MSDVIGASASGLTFVLKVSKKKGNRGKSEGLLDNQDRLRPCPALDGVDGVGFSSHYEHGGFLLHRWRRSLLHHRVTAGS